MKYAAAIIALFLFSLNTPYAADYYWVGGPGNWSDISHWATSSGGNTQHPQTPTAEDDVHFDGNSFNAAGQSVTIDIDIAFCHHLNFEGAQNPIIQATENRSLQIFGSFTLIPGMQFNFMVISSLEVTKPAKQLPGPDIGPGKMFTLIISREVGLFRMLCGLTAS